MHLFITCECGYPLLESALTAPDIETQDSDSGKTMVKTNNTDQRDCDNLCICIYTYTLLPKKLPISNYGNLILMKRQNINQIPEKRHYIKVTDWKKYLMPKLNMIWCSVEKALLVSTREMWDGYWPAPLYRNFKSFTFLGCCLTTLSSLHSLFIGLEIG